MTTDEIKQVIQLINQVKKDGEFLGYQVVYVDYGTYKLLDGKGDYVCEGDIIECLQWAMLPKWNNINH